MKTLVIFVPEYRRDTSFVEQIIKVAEEKQLETKVNYISKQYNPLEQQQFLYSVHVADIVIVDCTIPQNITLANVYPVLTAQINYLNHIIVVSENNLPLNITPYRHISQINEGEVLSMEQIIYGYKTNVCGTEVEIKGLRSQIDSSLKEDNYMRLSQTSFQDFESFQEEMEKMMDSSFDNHKGKNSDKIPVMISYRNSHSEEVEQLRQIIESQSEENKQKRVAWGLEGEYEVKVLPPASLCGAFEAHTPMRRWMLVGLLEDTIKEVEELWVYESRDKDGNIDYTDSWWTIAELVMLSYLNQRSSKKIKVRVFNTQTREFYPQTPERYLVTLSEDHLKKLARYLANTRPGTMGPECRSQSKQLKRLGYFMRFAPEAWNVFY